MAATKVSGHEAVIQLLECCDEPLRRDFTRTSSGNLTDKTIDIVLCAIRKVAVCEENTMVARVTLHNMWQDQDKTVWHFGVCVCRQANICKFVITCPSCKYNMNYTDAIVRDILSRGIGDPDIQLDVLGDKNQDMSLEEVFQFIEAKEAGKRSASRLLNTYSVEAAHSSYQRTKHPLDEDKKGPCSYCGKCSHGMKSATQKPVHSLWSQMWALPPRQPLWNHVP